MIVKRVNQYNMEIIRIWSTGKPDQRCREFDRDFNITPLKDHEIQLTITWQLTIESTNQQIGSIHKSSNEPISERVNGHTKKSYTKYSMGNGYNDVSQTFSSRQNFRWHISFLWSSQRESYT
jgi:hypothetical protein